MGKDRIRQRKRVDKGNGKEQEGKIKGYKCKSGRVGQGRDVIQRR